MKSACSSQTNIKVYFTREVADLYAQMMELRLTHEYRVADIQAWLDSRQKLRDNHDN